MILVLLALAAVLLLILSKLVNSDQVGRFFRYMGLRDKEGYGCISFEGSAGTICAGFGDGVLLGTENSLALYALDGEQKAMIQGSLPTPVLRTGGDVSFVFSPGSAYAASIGTDGTVLMDSTISGSYLNADVSFDGYAAFITSETGYKSVATVLNKKQEAIYRFSSRTRYLNACAISEKGAYLAVARLEEENGIFRSSVAILRTDTPLSDLEHDGNETAWLDLGNQMVYALHFLDQTHLVAIAQDEIVFLDVQGELLGQYSTRTARLTDYAISAKGWMLLSLEQNAGSYHIMTLDASGQILGESNLQDRVRSVSAAEDYAAVLTESCVQTYDCNLDVRDRSWDVLSITKAIARPDGTVLLVGSSETKLYIP